MGPKGIKFGDNDLVIENDFKNIRSEINGEYFTVGSYIIKNKIISIIPTGMKGFEPDNIEVWSFNI